MRREVVAVFLIAITPIAAADVFQFEFGAGGPLAANARVRVFNASNRQVFESFTDGYGRIVIATIANGKYTLRVLGRSGERSIEVEINGNRRTRMLTLPK